MDDRRATVLRAVVEQFISDAQPVGSQTVVQNAGLGVSAATVRHELGALESEGYLAQPHTSAGRVPTESGYRYFVDHLRPGRLNVADYRRVRDFFAHAEGQIEARLADTSRLLAQLTTYASLVVAPSNEGETVMSTQLVDLGRGRLMFLLVTASGAVERHFIEVAFNAAGPPSAADLEGADAWLAARFVGKARLAVHRSANAPDARAEATAQLHRGAAEAAASVLEVLGSDGTEPGGLYVGGVSAATEQFGAIETLQSVLALLEEQLLVVSLLRDLVERGLSVAIGTETGMQPLADCSVVVAPYRVDGAVAGSIGLVGPTRMDYGRALAAVQLVSSQLSESLSVGTIERTGT